ncbi:DUF1036 domain-containing protein [Phormidium tenue FACHB-886]|nr:DUF1036 domain-containing protein [Phormidium tenue FACHB-886]
MKQVEFWKWLAFPTTALTLAVGAVLATPKPAQAYFEVCNATSETVWTAIGYRSNGQWWAEGWWQLSSGQCATVIAEPLDEYYYYVHAHTSNRTAVWENNHTFCTSNQPFTLQDQSSCNERTDKFFEVNTGESTDFTQNLCPPSGCGSGSNADDGFNLDTFASATVANRIVYVRPRSRSR